MKKRILIAAVAVALPLASLLAWWTFRFIQTDKLNQVARSGDIAAIDTLLNQGAALNGRGMHGMTPLMSACAAGELPAACHLIELGADINGHNDSGSVLMWAIDSGNIELVSLLLDQGVDTGWKNHFGGDARGFAKEKGDPAIVELLH